MSSPSATRPIETRHGKLPISGANVRALPLSVYRGAPGPVIALLSACDRSDAAASMVLRRLMQRLEGASLRGTVIVLPHATPIHDTPRHGELPDMHDLHERAVLDALESTVIATADVVLEWQPSGGALQRIPTLGVPEQPRQDEAEALMIAIGTDNSARLPPPLPGSLEARVVDAGKLMLKGWVGSNFSGSLALEASLQGLINLLVHLQMIEAEYDLRSTRMLRLWPNRHRIVAPCGGMLMPLAELNEDCHADSALAEILNLDHPDSVPVQIDAPHTGVLWAMHRAGPVRAGDCIAVIAEPLPI